MTNCWAAVSAVRPKVPGSVLGLLTCSLDKHQPLQGAMPYRRLLTRCCPIQKRLPAPLLALPAAQNTDHPIHHVTHSTSSAISGESKNVTVVVWGGQCSCFHKHPLPAICDNVRQKRKCRCPTYNSKLLLTTLRCTLTPSIPFMPSNAEASCNMQRQQLEEVAQSTAAAGKCNGAPRW